MRKIVFLFFLICFFQPELVRCTDAPVWTIDFQKWNLAKDYVDKVQEKFGKASFWRTGDGGCSQRNYGYTLSVDGKDYYAVFYTGEMRRGLRITRVKNLVPKLRYYEVCSEELKSDVEFPIFPFPQVQEFKLPNFFGWSEKTFLDKLGKPKKIEKRGLQELKVWEWKAKMRGTHDFWDVWTDLYIGFSDGKLVYFEVHRYN